MSLREHLFLIRKNLFLPWFWENICFFTMILSKYLFFSWFWENICFFIMILRKNLFISSWFYVCFFIMILRKYTMSLRKHFLSHQRKNWANIFFYHDFEKILRKNLFFHHDFEKMFVFSMILRKYLFFQHDFEKIFVFSSWFWENIFFIMILRKIMIWFRNKISCQDIRLGFYRKQIFTNWSLSKWYQLTASMWCSRTIVSSLPALLRSMNSFQIQLNQQSQSNALQRRPITMTQKSNEELIF